MIVAHPDLFKVSHEPTDRDILLVGKHIERDGLIEPLKLDKNGVLGTIDYYDPARLRYCQLADWPTVIADYDDDIPRSENWRKQT